MKKITFLSSAILFVFYVSAQCNEPSNIGWDIYGYTNIVWDANGEDTWDVEYGAAGFNPTGNPNVEDLIYSSFSIYEVNEANTYIDVYVRADCGTNTSDWVGPFTFFNYCIEDCAFDNFESGIFQECWSESNDGSPTTGLGSIDTSLWEIDSFANTHNNSAKINIAGNQVNEWLITPRILGTVDVYLLVEFDMALTEYNSTNTASLGSDDEIVLGVSVDLGESWEVIRTWNSNSAISNTGEHHYIVTGFEGIDYIPFLVAFWASSGNNTDPENVDFFIDNFYVCFTLGIEESLVQKGFTYYPNPSNTSINLNAKESIDHVAIYNNLGQQLKEVSIYGLSHQLDISDLPNAVYFMQVTIGNTTGVVKVVKN